MGVLSSSGDLALVVIGFGLIIFLHELGHFAAARWARIRVLAFAIGFGPAVVSFRKGLGWRRGSSEKEYRRLIEKDGAGASGIGGLGTGAGTYERGSSRVSPTEYRINILPLGGYVKMLGQDDSDPTATSGEPDSFGSAPVYKRMVVISAGVVMNLITAAALFIIVFFAGLRTESPRLGEIVPGSPAAVATALDGSRRLNGLQRGDTVISVNDDPVESFNDISLAVAMSAKEKPLSVTVRRPGVDEPLTFITTPRVEKQTGLLSIGVYPSFSGTLVDGATEKDRNALAERFGRNGAPGLHPAMTLCDPQGKELDYPWLEEAAKKSGGTPIQTYWLPRDGAGRPPVPITITPAPQLQGALVERDGATLPTEHLAGLTPVMSVRAVSPDSNADKAGVKAGDVFVRLGEVQWPSIDDGLRQIRAPGRTSIAVTVLRAGEIIDLNQVPVSDGKIGFEPATTARTGTLITRFPRGKIIEDDAPAPRDAARPFAATAAEVTPGSRIVAVGSSPTDTLYQVRTEIQRLIAAGKREIPLSLELPGPKGADAPAPSTVTLLLRLDEADAGAIAGLGWTSPIPMDMFLPAQVVIKRSTPVGAVAKGLQETHKMILTTYLTFARLFQGSVKVEHLKGPIGIADVGTKFAGRGWIWLLFFMAAVSVNLAVVNFLPLPIVDGGHFCFLLWEQFTGRPVSPAVQNVAALLGLALIGAVFLMTTYNDLANLLWR